MPDEPPPPTGEPARYELTDGRPDVDTLYTRCPECTVIAPIGSVVYHLGEGRDLDPAAPITITCLLAGHRYRITAAAVLARDATTDCNYCGNTFAIPANADEVVCLACRAHHDGPGRRADPVRAEQQHQQHAAWLTGLPDQTPR
jgi:hypothetical protein